MSSESNTHTPGPWMVASHPVNGRLPIVSQANGRSVGAVSWLGDMPEGFKGHEDECMANARLIAAAPELLDALIDILVTEPALKGGPYDRAMAAVAKAEGRTPTKSANPGDVN